MMGNERGQRGRQAERHSQGESRKKERGLIERERHKVELELFFLTGRTKREAERAAE